MTWEYRKTSDEAELAALGLERWEAYAAFRVRDRRAANAYAYDEVLMFFLKRPVSE